MKVCNKCHKLKPLYYFSKNNQNKVDGHRSDCKECLKPIKKKEYLAATKGKRTRRVFSTIVGDHKDCLSCKEVKLLTEFEKNGSWYRGSCKACVKKGRELSEGYIRKIVRKRTGLKDDEITEVMLEGMKLMLIAKRRELIPQKW